MAPAGPRPVAGAYRSGRTPVPVILGVAACSLAAFVVVITVMRGGTVPALVGLVLAVLPIPLVLAGVLYLDRLEPEPRSLLAAVFGAGAAAGALSGLAGRALGSHLIWLPELGSQAGRLIGTTLGAAIFGAVVAETLMGAVLVTLLRYRAAELDGASDGVVYGTVTGLGFALIVNLFAYLQAVHTGLGALASAFARRGILAPLWDPLFASLIGVGVAYAAMRPGRRGWWAIGGGWAAAVALHALWASSATAAPGQLAVVYLILLGALAALLAAVVADRRRIVAMISGYLPAYQADGVVTARDVEMLASLRWRRLARQWARLHRGRSAARAMTEYQLAATELALAGNREDRHLMGPGTFAARRDELLAQMRAAISICREPQLQLQPPPWAPSGTSVFVAWRKPPGEPQPGRQQPTGP